MTVLDPRVRDHAHQVREWTEDRAHEFGSNSCLWGLCAIASGELWRRLKQNGIPAKLGRAEADYGNSQHVFVIFENHIVDVTATQFGRYKKVAVKPLNHKLHPWWWKLIDTFDSDDALHVHQTETGWVNWQCCNDFLSSSGEGRMIVE